MRNGVFMNTVIGRLLYFFNSSKAYEDQDLA